MRGGEIHWHNRAQAGLDGGAVAFEEGRQGEGFAEDATGSSVAKPGPSVAISKSTPPGSRK